MKSMGKTSRGNGFRGTLNYCLDHDSGKVIGGNMSGSNARDISREFSSIYKMRPQVKKPVWHQSLRLPAGEHISDEKWREISSTYMKNMGFDEDHPFTVIKHDKEDGEHVHIVASRVSLSGKLFYGKDENLLSTKVCHQLETEFNLQIKEEKELSLAIATPKKSLTKKEIDKATRTGWQPPKLQVTTAIDAHISNSRDLDDLIATLSKNGITVSLFTKDGIASGITFECEGLKFSGKSLGSDYKYQSIISRIGQNHEQNQQFAASSDTITTASTTERIQSRNGAIENPDKGGTQENECQNQRLAASNNRTSGLKNEQNLLNAKDTNMNINIFKNLFKKQDLAAEAAAAAEEDKRIKEAAAHQMQMRDNQNAEVCGFGKPSAGNHNRYPPSLGGKLTNHKNTEVGSYDLFKDGQSKPIFRACMQENTCQLLQKPTSENVADLFKVAQEMKIEQPLQVHGTLEFQRLAAREAIKSGIPCKFEDETVQSDYQERIKIAQEVELLNKKAEEEAKQRAYETEQTARANEICAAQERDAENKDKRGTAWKN